jgi:predicted aconitase with swiveling domain
MMQGEVLNAGRAEGPVLRLTEPLSFWGAFDPRTGLIVDVHHPQRGLALKGRILVMEESRGSGSAPGGIAEAVRLRTAPLGIVLGRADLNLAIGCLIAEILYGSECPVIALATEDFAKAAAAPRVAIDREGRVTLP